MNIILLFVRFLQIITVFLVISLLGLFGHVHWLFDLLAHFRVQLIGVTLVLLVVLLLLRIRTLTLICIVVLTLNIIDFYNVYSTSAPKFRQENAQTFRVMTYNMFFKNTNTDAIVAMVELENPDFFFIAEATTEAMQAMQRLSYRYRYFFPNPQQNRREMAFFSSLPWADIRFEEFPNSKKSAIVVTYQTAQGPLYFIGIHSASPLSAGETKLRNNQLREIAEYARDLSRSGSVIVAGDFNTTPWSVAYRDFMNFSGLKGTFPSMSHTPTWPAWLPYPLQIPIDHVMVSEHFGVARRKRGHNAGSDHFPVSVDLGFVSR